MPVVNTRFSVFDTPLEGLKLIQRKRIADNRGYLERLFCNEEMSTLIPGRSVVQINHSLTVKCGAVRGLHFQYPPHAEVKMVSCLRGEVFDVAVDVRHNSPTFMHWRGEILSAENGKSMLIPEGYAHGFQTLTSDCELIYLHTAAYHPEAEGALNVSDPRLNIAWPLPIDDLSERDRSHSFISLQYKGIVL
jgi:dTDP-4-dehydrorhamnose 3,5-epimerase